MIMGKIIKRIRKKSFCPKLFCFLNKSVNLTIRDFEPCQSLTLRLKYKEVAMRVNLLITILLVLPGLLFSQQSITIDQQMVSTAIIKDPELINFFDTGRKC
jgi:hypothetical protein